MPPSLSSHYWLAFAFLGLLLALIVWCAWRSRQRERSALARAERAERALSVMRLAEEQRLTRTAERVGRILERFARLPDP